MKKLYILLIALSAYLLVGCKNDPVLYNGPSFVSWYTETSTFKVKEATDGQIFNVYIGLTNTLSENVTLSVSVIDTLTTAVEGYDFSIVNSSVTIPAGELYGIVQIKGFYENLTYEALNIGLAINGIPTELYNKYQDYVINFKIKQLYNITKEWIEGDWVMTDYNYEDGEPAARYLVNISELTNDTIVMQNAGGYGYPIKALIDRNEGRIVIFPNQVMRLHASYGDIFMRRYNGADFTDGTIFGECGPNGIELEGWGSYTYVGGGYFGIFISDLIKY